MDIIPGDQYIGQFKYGFPEGKGIFIFSSGKKYEGEILAGSYQGNGKFTYEDGSSYEGEFGTVKGGYTHGTLYPTSDGLRHGYGVRRFCNGDRYEGEWNCDNREDGQDTLLGMVL